jgi:MraZ protein
VFAGSHEHSLDDKGRLVLPSHWRRHFEDGGFLAPWEDCLGLFPAAVFWELTDVIQERMEQTAGDADEARSSFRFFMSKAKEVGLDSGGRIVVPAALRAKGGISRDAVLIGMRRQIEIWDPARWAGAEEPGEQALSSAIRSMRL